MSLKAQLEAIIYAAEDPITLDQMAALLKDDLLALKTAVPPTPEATSDSEPPLQPQPEQAEDHLGAVEDTTPAPPAKKAKEKSEKVELRGLLRPYLDELIADYANPEHGIEIREVASGYRMSTKPEHHDVVVVQAEVVERRPERDREQAERPRVTGDAPPRRSKAPDGEEIEQREHRDDDRRIHVRLPGVR